MKMYLVEWRDSRFVSCGWHSRASVEDASLPLVVSLGILARETADLIILEPACSEDSFMQDIIIAKGAIRRMRQLQIKEPL